MEATSGLMRGGEESFYRWCVLRKGRSFKLRQDSAKFPRTDQAAPCRRLELSSPNVVEAFWLCINMAATKRTDTSSLSYPKALLFSSFITHRSTRASAINPTRPSRGMLSQVVFLWVMPKIILGLSCVRFFYLFHRIDPCSSGSGSLRSNVSYVREGPLFNFSRCRSSFR